MFGRYSRLEERVAKLEQGFKNVEMEWDLAYEKLRSLMGRIAKRAEAQADREAAAGDGADTAPAPENGPDRTATGRLLTPRQRQLQQEILRRRAGLGGGS